MSKERIFASFNHILDPTFGGGLESVLIVFKPKKWEVLDGTGVLQHQLSYHAASVNIKMTGDIQRLQEPK